MKKTIFIVFFSLVSFVGFSQSKDTVINGVHYQVVPPGTSTPLNKSSVERPAPEVSKNKKHVPPVDSTFILGNKKLKYYNSWITGGAGAQQNLSYKRALGFAGGLDFNFHIKQYYFQLGTEITGEKFGFYSNYQFHLGYGKRFEDKDIHFAGFIGPSYSSGYGKVDTVYTRKYTQVGAYLQFEFVKKIAYDVGIGASFFADVNQEQSLIGLRAILYFSGAYKGNKNGKRED